MEETLFSRIKRSVETEQSNQMRGEAKLESLHSEKQRILEDASKMIGKPIHSEEELSTYLDTQKREIESKINEAAALLKKEGIEF